MTKSVRVRVAGKVQGVWFRAWTTEQATGRGLSGWVRNCRDGSVEALFSGPADQVDSMIEACRDGPPAARVDHIDQHPADPPAERGFHQRHTE
jgi:acylphosphatase